MCTELSGQLQNNTNSNCLTSKINLISRFVLFYRSKNFMYSFRKKLPFTPVQPGPSDQGGAPSLPVFDEAGVDKDDG